MNRNLRAVAALASLAFVALAAAPALASGFCDPEEGPCGPPPPPPPPTLPGTVGTFGNYAVSLGTIQNSVFRQGVYQNGLTTFNGGGPLVPVGNNGVLTVGQPNNTVTLAPTLSPLGSVMVAAVATTPQDPVFPGFDLVARGSLELSYLVDLHANNQAAADALTNLLSVNGGIARINGDYSLTATGTSWGSVIASTGTSELANGLGGSFGKFCSLIGYSGTPDGCGSGSYSLALNFVAGSVYANGNPLDFYSVISLSASANAGPPDLGYAPGTMTAFIDPQITFGPGINLNDYSLSVGGVGTALVGAPSNGVPEPAAWAMMLVGFGGIGAMMRRRRPRAALA